MSEPLEGYAKFYIEIIEAVIEKLETLKPEFLKTVVFGELESMPDPNMMPAAFVIPRVDEMDYGTTAKTEHAITVDTVVLHRHRLVEGSVTPGLRKAIILAGKCYDTIIGDKSLGGKVRLVGGRRRFEPDYMFGKKMGRGVLFWVLVRVQAFKMRID